jgi:hypothetical protein
LLIAPARVFFFTTRWPCATFFGPRLVRFVPPPLPTDSQNAAASHRGSFLAPAQSDFSPLQEFSQSTNMINKHLHVTTPFLTRYLPLASDIPTPSASVFSFILNPGRCK